MQWEHVRYLASQEDSTMATCCFELHVSGPFPHSTMYPETDFWLSDIAQSESVKEVKMGYGFGVVPYIKPQLQVL